MLCYIDRLSRFWEWNFGPSFSHSDIETAGDYDPGPGAIVQGRYPLYQTSDARRKCTGSGIYYLLIEWPTSSTLSISAQD